MNDKTIYLNNATYARDHNELEVYRASYKASMECVTAISKAINGNYADNCLNSENALKELKEKFSLDRIAVITAVSIRDKDWDGRFSNENKEWAKSFPFPKDLDDWGRDRNAKFRVTEVHSGLLNIFTNTLRKELELVKSAPEKKPSLVEKLNRPLPQKSDAVKPTKEQEL